MPTIAFGGESGRPGIPPSEIGQPVRELEQGGEIEAFDALRSEVHGYLSSGLAYYAERTIEQARERGLSLTL